MTVYNAIHNNLYETVRDYFGTSEAEDPSYNLELLTWSSVLAVPQAVQSAEEARELAIDWQNWQSDQALSIGDLAEFASYFEELAAKFDLADEFRENGII
jgi:hypothetical protein